MDSSAAIYIDLPDTHLRTMAKIIHNKKNTPAQWRNMPPSSSLQAIRLKIAGNWWCSSKINNFQSPGATDFEIHLNTYRKIIGNIPSSHHQISRDSWLDLLLQGGMATSKENLEMQTDQARMTCARSRSKVRFKWC